MLLLRKICLFTTTCGESRSKLLINMVVVVVGGVDLYSTHTHYSATLRSYGLLLSLFFFV